MDETSQNLLDLAEKIGVMLAESSLSDDIKEHIATNLDKLSGEMLVTLFEGLKADDEEMKRVAFDTELYLKVQEDAWKKVEADQKSAADIVGNAWVEKLK
jgi:hypothetical protein